MRTRCCCRLRMFTFYAAGNQQMEQAPAYGDRHL